MSTDYQNRILAALPEAEREPLLRGLQPEQLTLGRVIFDLNKPATCVCFVECGVVSIVSVFSNVSAVETATVGPEGMVGLQLFLGAEQMAAQAFVQVSGTGWIVPRERFLDVLPRAPALRQLLGRYTQALITQMAQASACNRKHSMEERCARWLLMTADRAGDSFDLTQQFLSQMLGVRRASVTVAAGMLQKAGMIDYTRGRIHIVDREKLEQASCECYTVIRYEEQRLTGNGEVPPDPLELVAASADGNTMTGDGDS